MHRQALLRQSLDTKAKPCSESINKIDKLHSSTKIIGKITNRRNEQFRGVVMYPRILKSRNRKYHLFKKVRSNFIQKKLCLFKSQNSKEFEWKKSQRKSQAQMFSLVNFLNKRRCNINFLSTLLENSRGNPAANCRKPALF